MQPDLNNAVSLRAPAGQILTPEQLRRVAPSIYQEHPHSSRSDRYAMIPTSVVVERLMHQDFQPVFVAQSRSRVIGKADFTKHLIRFRHRSMEMVQVGDECYEVCILNSHDGSSAYQLFRGVYRLVCTNGLVCGDSYEVARVRHSGNVVDDVIDASFTVLEDSKRVQESMGEMKHLQLSAPESNAFAEAALMLRYPPSEEEQERKAPPVTPTQVLRPRRSADNGNALWTTFNRVQENLTQGGLRTATDTGRRSRTRAVNGISENLNLNRALWTLAERMKELKQEGRQAA